MAEGVRFPLPKVEGNELKKVSVICKLPVKKTSGTFRIWNEWVFNEE